MRRIAGIVCVVGVAVAFWFVAAGSGDKQDDRFWVELDNAFGLIEGGDLKIAGVRAGKITDLRLDERTHRAKVGFRVDRDGFGSLRADARCDARPQSLIGEYFLDCQPGTSERRMRPGDVIPVQRTSSTIAPDLINNIMRRPYRERFSIILGELGAAVAGRGDQLGKAIERAHPALRETDRVLAKLADQNRTIQQLVTDADAVVGDLSANRKDVGRFVGEARDTARASAERRRELAEGFRRLPAFLAELQRTMPALGTVAREQTPALRNLSASSKRLEELFDRLGPFADASRPAFDALGEASKTGRQAMAKAGPVVDELGKFAPGVPELGKNLAIVLEHLDDRRWAVEDDPRSPGGKGYTGLEALLTYVYDQVMSTNVFDSNVHYLKVAVMDTACANYADAKKVRDNPDLEKQCGARIGPKAPGVFDDDPTAEDEKTTSARRLRHKTDRTAEADAPVRRDEGSKDDRRDEEQPRKDADPEKPGVQLPQILPGGPSLPPIEVPTPKVPDVLGGDRPAPAGTPQVDTNKKLLDYLLGP
ncbi:MAG: MCE family protein [Solirubrobacterales bacterium]|nr:MCE family protein [Solirubrobacterales bacterium]